MLLFLALFGWPGIQFDFSFITLNWENFTSFTVFFFRFSFPLSLSNYSWMLEKFVISYFSPSFNFRLSLLLIHTKNSITRKEKRKRKREKEKKIHWFSLFLSLLQLSFHPQLSRSTIALQFGMFMIVTVIQLNRNRFNQLTVIARVARKKTWTLLLFIKSRQRSLQIL